MTALALAAVLSSQVFRLMKGAPQVVLKRAHNFQEIHDQVEQKIVEYANRSVGGGVLCLRSRIAQQPSGCLCLAACPPLHTTLRNTVTTQPEGRCKQSLKCARWCVDMRQDTVNADSCVCVCRGYRALGFGLADGNGSPDAPGTHWEFLGLLPLFDPPRHDTAETIRRCQHMGIGGEQTWERQTVFGHGLQA